jgi:hypothetical protein
MFTKERVQAPRTEAQGIPIIQAAMLKLTGTSACAASELLWLRYPTVCSFSNITKPAFAYINIYFGNYRNTR